MSIQGLHARSPDPPGRRRKAEAGWWRRAGDLEHLPSCRGKLEGTESAGGGLVDCTCCPTGTTGTRRSPLQKNHTGMIKLSWIRGNTAQEQDHASNTPLPVILFKISACHHTRFFCASLRLPHFALSLIPKASPEPSGYCVSPQSRSHPA